MLPLVLGGAFFGGVFAAVPLFFPSQPPVSLPQNDATLPGTLGHALSFFDADGTAPNTERLGGVSASEFLSVHPHCEEGKIWKGIDAQGKPLCDFRSIPLVMEVKLLEGSVKIDGVMQNAPYSFTTRDGQSLETTDGRATLQFVADNSLIRMNKQTRIKLVGGKRENSTIAQAVLEQGVLWGRVLTGTGMNFVRDGMVAGVRGTGIKFGIREDGKLTVAVPHSRNQGFKTLPGMGDVTDAIEMGCQGTNGEVKPLGLLLGDERVYDTANCSEITPQKKSGIQTLYDTDRWIAENVIEDIMYINSILADTQAHDTKKQAATAEKTITIPTTPAEKNALCAAGETYWEQFEGSISQKVCQSGNLLALAEFTPSASTSGGSSGGAGSAENAGVMQFKLGLAVPQGVPRKTIVRERYRDENGNVNTIRDNRCFGGSHFCSGIGWVTQENFWTTSLSTALGNFIHENKVDPCSGKTLYSILQAYRDKGYTHIYIPNANTGLDRGEGYREGGCSFPKQMKWNRTEYPEGIFFQKEQTFAPTDIGTGGYFVDGTDVLAYDLKAFESLGGLAGKRIEIEFADIQELRTNSHGFIAELGGMENTPTYMINFGYTNTPPTQVTESNIACTLRGAVPLTSCITDINIRIQNNVLSFTIPNGTYSTLYIGNNNKFDKPINTHIKSIRIRAPQ